MEKITDLTDAYDKMQATWEEMKHTVEEATSRDNEDRETFRAETVAKLDKLNADLDRLEAEQKRIVTARETQADRDAKDEYKTAFFEALRHKNADFERLGDEVKSAIHPLSVAEVKEMALGDDATGGFLAPPEFTTDIVRLLVEFSPVRELARVRGTSNRSVLVPTKSGSTAAKWVRELETRTDTGNFRVGMDDVPNHELVAESIISRQDLEDTVFDLEGELRRDFADQFSKAEGKAFLTGTGQGQPFGILSHADLTGTGQYVVPCADSTGHLIAYKDIIKLQHELPAPYARGASILVNRKTLGALRMIEDESGASAGKGAYIWAPGLAAGDPNTLAGVPYVECVDMDDQGLSATAAANKYVMIYGDLSRAYMIVDRVQMSVQRADELLIRTGQVLFLARRRVGGQIMLSEALRVLKTA